MRGVKRDIQICLGSGSVPVRGGPSCAQVVWQPESGAEVQIDWGKSVLGSQAMPRS